MYPILKDSGPKDHPLNGFWDQGPYMLGTWTLWGCFAAPTACVEEDPRSRLRELGWSARLTRSGVAI